MLKLTSFTWVKSQAHRIADIAIVAPLSSEVSFENIEILAAELRRRGVKWRDIMHYKQCTFVTN